MTTGRRTTNRIRSFVNELAHTIPNAQRLTRGKLGEHALVAKCRSLNADRLILVQRSHGGLGEVSFYELRNEELVEPSFTINLTGLKLRREYNTKGRVLLSAITVEPNALNRIESLANRMATFLELKIKEPTQLDPNEASLHFLSFPNSAARIVATSPASRVEVGPSIVVRSFAPE